MEAICLERDWENMWGGILETKKASELAVIKEGHCIFLHLVSYVTNNFDSRYTIFFLAIIKYPISSIMSLSLCVV